MANGKITKELKGLGLKVNDKEPNGETVSEVIKGIADDYDGDQDTKYTGGNGINITEENVINADVKVIETSNITGLTTEQCESLNVGDVVIKLTSNQKHTYTVSYKENNVGMCLTYVDASVSETVSYDCIEGNWVYNSTDVTELGGGSFEQEQADWNEADDTKASFIKNKPTIPSENHLYEHNIYMLYMASETTDECGFWLTIITNTNTPFTLSSLYNYLENNLFSNENKKIGTGYLFDDNKNEFILNAICVENNNFKFNEKNALIVNFSISKNSEETTINDNIIQVF